MKLGSALLCGLALISLSACSKDESSGGSGSMDITRFKVESLSNEQSITESDYAARLKSLNVKPRSCRKGAFASYKKGDRFVLSTRATVPSQNIKIEIVSNESVVSVKANEMAFSKVIESITGAGNATQGLVNKVSVKKCIARKGRVACSDGSATGSTPSDCRLSNVQPSLNVLSTGTFALQDGRSVPVLVKRTQSTAELACTSGVRAITLAEVTVQSNTVKSHKGNDCAASDTSGEVYGYARIQQDDGQVLSEADTRVLLAPAK